MITVLSFGGGVQSWGYAALIAQGVFSPPDLALMIDTGRECATTWEYLSAHRHQLPFDLQVITQPLPALFWPTGERDCLLPAYTQRGKLPPFCSGEWKRDVYRQTLRAQGVEECNSIMCISIDEFTRMKPSGVQWLTNVYPLCDARIRRGELLSAAAEYFGAPPPRSRCWMCPNQDRADWLVLPEHELAQAETIDVEIRARNELYLSKFRVPLRESLEYHAAQGDFFEDDCDGGYCFV